jgi:hypothetical protein
MADIKVIKLCCGGRGCPTIEKKDTNYIIIKDDFGNQVTIKAAEAALIQEALKQL